MAFLGVQVIRNKTICFVWFYLVGSHAICCSVSDQYKLCSVLSIFFYEEIRFHSGYILSFYYPCVLGLLIVQTKTVCPASVVSIWYTALHYVHEGS